MTARPDPAPPPDAGSASLYVLWLCLVLAVAAPALALAGLAFAAGARAQAAADFAALAAADSAYLGSGAACARAGRLAERNGGRLVSCAFSGPDVTVVAEVELDGVLRPVGPVRVRSRAGPAREVAATRRRSRRVAERDLGYAPAMRCSSCEATISASTRFCPSCGTLFDAGHANDAASVGASAGAATQLMSAPGHGPDGPIRSTAPPTAPIPVAGAASSGTDAAFAGEGARSTPAAETAPTAQVPVADARGDLGREPHRSVAGSDALRTKLDASTERLRTAAPEVRAAMVGTAIVLLGFLFLPYALGLGTGVATGGRVWWRPIAAIVATVLLAIALRHDPGTKPADGLADPYPGHVAAGSGSTAGAGTTAVRDHRMLVVAIVLSTLGATEAGLIGLVSGDNGRLQVGYYVILLGSVIVAAAAVVAALRRAPR